MTPSGFPVRRAIAASALACAAALITSCSGTSSPAASATKATKPAASTPASTAAGATAPAKRERLAHRDSRTDRA